MDTYCTFAIESLLRSEFESKFKEFYFTICPRFKNFNERQLDSSGNGLDLLMYEAYRDFIVFFDSNIQLYLDKMGVTLEAFEDSLSKQIDAGDSSAISLLEMMNSYSSFLKFSSIMETKYIETFDQKSEQQNIEILPEAEPVDIEKVATAIHGMNINDNKGKAVRCLWDIENISIPKGVGGVGAVTKLNR